MMFSTSVAHLQALLVIKHLKLDVPASFALLGACENRDIISSDFE